MKGRKQSELVRAIGRWSLVALVVNTVIASGVFGLPSVIANLVGQASPYAYLIAAIGMLAIVGCFAEVASRFDEAGGPYLYARVAFGGFFGIQIGWLSWLVRLTACAANANLFVIYLGQFWPQATEPAPRLMILTLLLGFLAVVNYRGVSGGARLSNVFAVSKLLPLACFIGIGLFFLGKRAPAASVPTSTSAWLEAVLIVVYAYGGFEAPLMPMAEAKNPRRDAPFALLTALAIATILYTLIQVVVIGVLSTPMETERPLAAAAEQFLGSPGAVLISVGALVSLYGYLSSAVLNSPRLTYALAERGDFPSFFAAVHPRYRTPHISIAIFVVLVWGLAVAGSFRWNVTLSAVARLFTYVATCAALPVLRKRQPGEQAFRLPVGSLLALLGIGFSLVLVSRMGRGELEVLIATTVVALVNWVWVRRRNRLDNRIQ